MIRVVDLPPELLQGCFSRLLKESGDGWLQPFRGSFNNALKDLTPEDALVPLLRTCKLWYNVAEPLLYTSITITRNLKQLRNSFANRRHADLVHRLRIIHGCDEEAFSDVIDIIKLCINITHLEISGDGTPGRVLVGDLFTAMQKPMLIHVIININGIHSTNHVLKNMLLHWKHLERISVLKRDHDTSVLADDVMAMFADSGGSLNQLRNISLESPLSYQQVRALSLVTLNSPLEHIQISLDQDSRLLPVLHTCLQRWAPTLQHFVLYFGRDKWSVPPNVGSMIGNLHQLVELDCDSHYQVSPGTMSHLKKLSKLIYKIDSIDQLEALTEALACTTGPFLPSLENIDLNAEIADFKTARFRDAEASFHHICQSRGLQHHKLNSFYQMADDIRQQQGRLHLLSMARLFSRT